MEKSDQQNQEELLKKYIRDLKGGYYKTISGEKCLKSEFIVKYPKKIAEMLRSTDKNRASQIWKFYNYTRKIKDSLNPKDSLNSEGKSFAAVKADLDWLRPAVAYAMNRGTVTWVFKRFIDVNILQIKEEDDLEAFVKHFQALIAYLPKRNQK